MRKVLFVILAGIIFLAINSCRNFEIAHPDFEYTTGYFPYQFPIRTLVLGESIYDNSNDNSHRFLISIHIGGVYSNKVDRKFDIEIDNDLTDDIYFKSDEQPVLAMPKKYYSLNSNTIIVPKGSMYGSVEVELTNDFFNDPKSIGINYVIPLKIINFNGVDSVLRGEAAVPDADPRIEDDWVEAPRDFTLFGVKFINEYQGTYFRFGKSETNDPANNQLGDSSYSSQYVVDNSTVKLKTTKRNQAFLSMQFYSQAMSGEFEMLLTFDGNDCTISSGGTTYNITGSGSYLKDAFTWGNKQRDGIVLDYTVSDGNHSYSASDTLALRDRGVVMETFTPIKK